MGIFLWFCSGARFHALNPHTVAKVTCHIAHLQIFRLCSVSVLVSNSGELSHYFLLFWNGCYGLCFRQLATWLFAKTSHISVQKICKGFKSSASRKNFWAVNQNLLRAQIVELGESCLQLFTFSSFIPLAQKLLGSKSKLSASPKFETLYSSSLWVFGRKIYASLPRA